MNKIAINGRLILRKILTVLSLGMVAFVFQACYGLPSYAVRGVVKSSDKDEPIYGIKVSPSEYGNYHDLTNSNGEFELFLGNYDMSLFFTDIENDEFEDKEIVLYAENIKNGTYLVVHMDRKP